MKALLPLILAVTLQTVSFGQSLFQQHTLAGGIAIQIPTNWKILDSATTQQFDTNTEATTGTAQGNNKILLAANLFLSEPHPAATARLSVRAGPTLSEREFRAMPESEFQAQSGNNRAGIERSLRSAGYSLLTYSEAREMLAGHLGYTSTYVSAKNGHQVVNVLSILFLGDRKIKLHVTYDLATEASTKATTDRIRGSLTTPK